MWSCKCDCGNTVVVRGGNLRRGLTQSCGCLQRERASEARTTHGHTRGYKLSPTYITWQSAIERTTNPKQRFWKRYGGRGIRVCRRWRGKNGFANFYADMGRKPKGMTLDRIDNDKGYCKSNCRWATQAEQVHNSSVSKLTSSKVVEIRKRVAAGESQNAVARNFEVTQHCVWSIMHGRTWQHAAA